mgnify:FL=1
MTIILSISLVISTLAVIAAVHFKAEALGLARELSGTREELEGELHQLKEDAESHLSKAIETAFQEGYESGYDSGVDSLFRGTKGEYEY